MFIFTILPPQWREENDLASAEALASRGLLREALQLARRLPPELRRRGKMGVLVQFIISGQFGPVDGDKLYKLGYAIGVAVRLGLESDEAAQLRADLRALAERRGLV